MTDSEQPVDLLTPEQIDELRAALTGIGFPGAITALVMEQLTQTQPDWGYCPKCRQKVRADFPDRKARVKAIETVLGYVIGKPAERKQVDVTVTTRNVAEMDAAERDQYRQELLRRVRGEITA